MDLVKYFKYPAFVSGDILHYGTGRDEPIEPEDLVLNITSEASFLHFAFMLQVSLFLFLFLTL
jgi:hypothetical protein